MLGGEVVLRRVRDVVDASLTSRLLTLGVVVALAGTAWRTGAVNDGPTICPFRLLTGLPCPGCGTTRALTALSAGDLSAALSLNPVAVGLAGVGVGFFLSPAARTSVFEKYEVSASKGVRWVWIGLALLGYALLWLWNVSRW